MAFDRFSAALSIQEGACNPSGIARSLVAAIDAARDENPDTDAVRADPAVRLIAHQLAYLLGVSEIDNGFDVYANLMDACRREANAVKAAQAELPL